MSTPNKHGKPPDNMELLKQQASACGPDCACNATGTSGKARWVIGVLVLVAAGVMVVQAMVKKNGATTQASATTFADPVAPQTVAAMVATATESGVAAAVTGTSVGTILSAFSELNTVAAKMDAVFIYLPAKEGTSGNAPSKTMNNAARMIEAQGMKCGLFTLKPGSRDYDQVAAQMSVPCVLAMVKGGGMSATSGDITESKLIQGFLAASRSGSCGPSAGAGCCPR